MLLYTSPIRVYLPNVVQHPDWGEQVDVRQIPDQYLKETQIEDGFETRPYQMQLLHKDFPDPLSVVILLRTNLATKAWANVVLFSSDLELPYDKLIDFYSLRFQTEFNFRDAKQFWGDDNLVSQLFHKVAALGRIHPAKEPVSSG